MIFIPLNIIDHKKYSMAILTSCVIYLDLLFGLSILYAVANTKPDIIMNKGIWNEYIIFSATTPILLSGNALYVLNV
jgi:hypothetical protein